MFSLHIQTENVPLARAELHRLLEDPELRGTPLLVLANKIDVEPSLSEQEMVKELNLDYISEADNPVCCQRWLLGSQTWANPFLLLPILQWVIIPISALKGTNVDRVANHLVVKGRNGGRT